MSLVPFAPASTPTTVAPTRAPAGPRTASPASQAHGPGGGRTAAPRTPFASVLATVQEEGGPPRSVGAGGDARSAAAESAPPVSNSRAGHDEAKAVDGEMTVPASGELPVGPTPGAPWLLLALEGASRMRPDEMSEDSGAEPSSASPTTAIAGEPADPAAVLLGVPTGAHAVPVAAATGMVADPGASAGPAEPFAPEPTAVHAASGSLSLAGIGTGAGAASAQAPDAGNAGSPAPAVGLPSAGDTGSPDAGAPRSPSPSASAGWGSGEPLPPQGTPAAGAPSGIQAVAVDRPSPDAGVAAPGHTTEPAGDDTPPGAAVAELTRLLSRQADEDPATPTAMHRRPPGEASSDEGGAEGAGPSGPTARALDVLQSLLRSAGDATPRQGGLDTRGPEVTPAVMAGLPAANAAASPSIHGPAAPPAFPQGAGLPQGVADQITAHLVSSLKLQWREGVGEARLQLRPDAHGTVTVAIRVEQGAVTALVRAESPQVQEWVLQHQQTLRQQMEAAGLRLDDLRVVPDDDRGQSRQQEAPPERRRRFGQAPGKAEADTPRFELVV